MNSRISKLQFRRYCLVLLPVLLWVSLTGCSFKFIADYDETTDKAVTQLQRKMETFLTEIQRKVGTDEAAYSRHIPFYDGVRVDLSAIQVRAVAIPKNEITVKQVLLVRENLDTLEKLHKLGFRNPEELEPLRKAFNTSFTAILKLELAKKRGEKGE